MEETTQTENEVEEKKMNPMMIGGIVVALLVLGGGFLFLQNKGQSPAQTETAEVVGAEIQDTSDATTELEILVVNIEAGSFYYKPNQIRAKVGQSIKIVMISKDMMHDFNIDELGVSIPITKAGDTATVEFTPTIAGEFEFYCSVGQHRKQGQVGKLIVE